MRMPSRTLTVSRHRVVTWLGVLLLASSLALFFGEMFEPVHTYVFVFWREEGQRRDVVPLELQAPLGGLALPQWDKQKRVVGPRRADLAACTLDARDASLEVFRSQEVVEDERTAVGEPRQYDRRRCARPPCCGAGLR